MSLTHTLPLATWGIPRSDRRTLLSQLKSHKAPFTVLVIIYLGP